MALLRLRCPEFKSRLVDLSQSHLPLSFPRSFGQISIVLSEYMQKKPYFVIIIE